MAHNLDISPSIQIKFSHIKCLSSDLISNLCPNDQPHIMEEVKRKIQIQTNLKSCQHLPFRKNVKNAIIQCRKKITKQNFHANLVNSSKCCKSIPPATLCIVPGKISIGRHMVDYERQVSMVRKEKKWNWKEQKLIPIPDLIPNLPKIAKTETRERFAYLSPRGFRKYL